MRTPLLAVAFACVVLGVRGRSPALPSPLFRALEEPLPREAGYPLHAADFDGDGDQDLLCTNGVQLNDGQARFLPRLGSPSFGSWWLVLSGDIDGNGSIDVVTIENGSSTAPTLRRWTNDGTGLLTPSALNLTIPSPYFVSAALLADFDGDGDRDLYLAVAALGGWGAVPAPPRLWLNGGAGSFVDASSQVPAQPFFIDSAVALDFDVDGDRDVVVFGSGAPAPRALLMNSAGFFAPVAPPNAASAGGNPCTGDFDGDGILDLAVFCNVPSAGIEVDLVRPGGAFSTIVTPWPASATIHAADVDGNGRDDLVSFGVGGTCALHLVAPNGAVSPPTGGNGDPLLSYLPRPVLADFDGDGDKDAAYVTSFTNRLLLNGGQTSFVPIRTPVPPEFVSVHAGDVEGDGVPDLIDVSGNPANGLATAFNDANGNFIPHPTAYPRITGVYGIADWVPVDVDGDGDRDLFRASNMYWADGEIAFNTGTGWLLATTPVSGYGMAWVAKAADLDADGDQDIVVAQSANSPSPLPGPAGTCHLNGGTGTSWTAVPLAATDVVASDVAIADVDGDADPDILVASAAGSTPARSALFLNQGGGTFTRSAGFNFGTAIGVALGDLDGDGDADCVHGGQVLRNLGAGAFVAASAMPGGDRGRITLADVDGDGFIDVVGAYAWSRNLGACTFGAPESYHGPFAPVVSPALPPTRTWPHAPDVVDVDRDGDLDVVAQSGRIYSNLSRHLSRGILARPGRVATLDVWGSPNSPWLLAAAAAPSAMSLGAAGTLLLEPTAIGFVTAGTLTPAGRATFSAMVPAVPIYVGATIYWQAWIGTSNRLTNLELMTVVGG